MAQAQNATGTAGSGGAQQGSAVYQYGAGQGAGMIGTPPNNVDSGQLTETHVAFHNGDAAFTSIVMKIGG